MGVERASSVLTQLLLGAVLIMAGVIGGRVWEVDPRQHEREGVLALPCTLSPGTVRLLEATAKCTCADSTEIMRGLREDQKTHSPQETPALPQPHAQADRGPELAQCQRHLQETKKHVAELTVELQSARRDVTPGAAACPEVPKQDCAKECAGRSGGAGAAASGAESVQLLRQENADVLRMDVPELVREIEDLRMLASNLRQQNRHLLSQKRLLESTSRAQSAGATLKELFNLQMKLNSSQTELLKCQEAGGGGAGDCSEAKQLREDLRSTQQQLQFCETSLDKPGNKNIWKEYIHLQRKANRTARELQACLTSGGASSDMVQRLKDTEDALNSTRNQLRFWETSLDKPGNGNVWRELVKLQSRLNRTSTDLRACVDSGGGTSSSRVLMAQVQVDLNQTKEALTFCIAHAGAETDKRLWKELVATQARLNRTRVELDAALARVEGSGSASADCAASSAADCSSLKEWKGYHCQATPKEMRAYMRFRARASCPNDWPLVQRLIFQKNCFALPRRRCRAVTPGHVHEPVPFPQSLFSQDALLDSNVRWDHYQCTSYSCLNTAAQEAQALDESPGEGRSRLAPAACPTCFNMSLEMKRWGPTSTSHGAITMASVLEMKKGGLRLGLDMGGGSGSFAAHMAKRGVTILTATSNIDPSPPSTHQSPPPGPLPFLETIALRGLIPLPLPPRARLPLFDGVMDLVHWGSDSSTAALTMPRLQFEELVYEWDRVLRVGGIIWLDPMLLRDEDVDMYVGVLKLLGYKKLYWNTPRKADGVHVYLNCVLEKLPAPGPQAAVRETTRKDIDSGRR